MRLDRLRLENLRAFRSLELELGPRWNVFVGPNGAGKTTLLEAAYLLSHARSFRSGARDALIRRGAEGFSVFGSLARAAGAELRVGLSRNGGRLEARVDGESIAVSELLHHVAVVCFEPGSHELVAGPSELRRRFLDWGVFHVEPDFLATWRRYQRALKQRNTGLKAGAGADELDAWDAELGQSGEALAAMRRRYLDRFAPAVVAQLARLLGELGAATVTLSDGWGSDVALAEQLAVTRDDDLRRGYTGYGPHRADWSITFAEAGRRDHLSRGQEKLCALGCVLGQAGVFAADRGEWPVICIDDLASELDSPHQEILIRTLPAEAQVLVTGTHEPATISASEARPVMFHVEPGKVAPLL